MSAPYPPEAARAAEQAIRMEMRASRDIEPARLAIVALDAAMPLIAGPDPREAHREHFRRLFEYQRQARELGDRHIISCGSGWRGSFYGAVVATYPEGSRIARKDSWRCHHEHPDDLAALECALGEVRRLTTGIGAYEPCSAGPDCTDRGCSRDWARLSRDRRRPGLQ